MANTSSNCSGNKNALDHNENLCTDYTMAMWMLEIVIVASHSGRMAAI